MVSVKRKRLATLFQINETLENYCNVCPYSGHNTPHVNCGKCPVSGLLRDYGIELGWKEDKFKPKTRESWTDQDDKTLLDNIDRLSANEIAEMLGRSVTSVYNRVKRMKAKGIL